MIPVLPRLTTVSIIFFISLLCIPCAVKADQTVSVDADVQFAYAASLYAGGDFLMAAAEYKRFIYLFPGHDRVEEAAYNVGLCHLSARQYGRAVQSFKEIMLSYPDGRYTDQAQFRMSEAYLSSNQAGAAITSLRNLAFATDDADVRDEAYYRVGWVYIGMGQWEQALTVFAEISQEGRNTYRLEELSRALAEEPKMKQKGATLAGTLAIIPGAGYLYCGRYQDALIALLVNGGLIWAAYEAFNNDLYALGSVITFVEIGFYAGNIYGSVASAHKYNRKKEQQWIENLRQNLKVNLASRPKTRGIELSLRYTF
jgi:outer membrane protein assembly factor BamD (BamD/ComL family)